MLRHVRSTNYHQKGPEREVAPGFLRGGDLLAQCVVVEAPVDVGVVPDLQGPLSPVEVQSATANHHELRWIDLQLFRTHPSVRNAVIGKEIGEDLVLIVVDLRRGE